MGFFSKKKSEEKPEQPVTLYDLHQAAKKEADPAKSGALYLKLIEKAATEDDQTWLRVGLCELAFGGGAQRDLARLRLLAEKLTDEDERDGFLRDLDELEPRGLEAAGESKERMRAFLLGAALDGSNAAAWQIANCLGAATHRPGTAECRESGRPARRRAVCVFHAGARRTDRRRRQPRGPAPI